MTSTSWDNLFSGANSQVPSAADQYAVCCRDTFDQQRKNIRRVFAATSPSAVACLDAGLLNDIPYRTFLATGAMVYLADWLPGSVDVGVMLSIIETDADGRPNCMYCNPRIPSVQRDCRHFQHPTGNADGRRLRALCAESGRTAALCGLRAWRSANSSLRPRDGWRCERLWPSGEHRSRSRPHREAAVRSCPRSRRSCQASSPAAEHLPRRSADGDLVDGDITVRARTDTATLPSMSPHRSDRTAATRRLGGSPRWTSSERRCWTIKSSGSAKRSIAFSYRVAGAISRPKCSTGIRSSDSGSPSRACPRCWRCSAVALPSTSTSSPKPKRSPAVPSAAAQHWSARSCSSRRKSRRANADLPPSTF